MLTGAKLNYHHLLLHEFGIYGTSFQGPRQIIVKLGLTLTKTLDPQKNKKSVVVRKVDVLLITNHDYFAQ